MAVSFKWLMKPENKRKDLTTKYLLNKLYNIVISIIISGITNNYMSLIIFILCAPHYKFEEKKTLVGIYVHVSCIETLCVSGLQGKFANLLCIN